MLLVFLLIAVTTAELLPLYRNKTPIYANDRVLDRLSSEESDYLGQECGYRGVSRKGRKINGGTEAMPGEFPWTVSLNHGPMLSARMQFCSGTLISDRHVITAAHCFFNRSGLEYSWTPYVALGGTCSFREGVCESDLVYNRSRHFFIRPIVKKAVIMQYFGSGKTGGDGDIAILELDTPVPLSDRVRPACLTGSAYEVTEETKLYSNGFGITEENGELSSPVLRQFNTQMINHHGKDFSADCLNTISSEGSNLYGDSGSGLIAEKNGRFTIVGALSGVAPAHTGGNSISCNTDLRYYIDAICVITGICYPGDSSEY